MTALLRPEDAQREDAASRKKPLRLARRVDESAVIRSFFFEDPEGQPLWPFRAGQHLVLEVPGPNGRMRPKTYTISSSPQDLSFYRLTVKREDAPTHMPDLPAGLGSGFLHDQVVVGDTVMVHQPRGDFRLRENTRPIVMLSGGVGLTPMVSMLADLVGRGDPRPVHFLHACQDGSVHALGAEVRELCRRHRNARLHLFYERPRPTDLPVRDFDSPGRIDLDAMRLRLSLDDYDFYLCGPEGFMRAIYGALRTINIAADRVSYEFFGPQKTLEPAPRIQPVIDKSPLPTQVGPSVSFARSAVRAAWTGQHRTLLDLAEASGVPISYSCREGVCGTCSVRLLSGSVAYLTEPIAWIEPGNALSCCARPEGDVELDV